MNGRFLVYADLLAIRKPACSERSGSLKAHRSLPYIIFILILHLNRISAASRVIWHNIQANPLGIGLHLDHPLRLDDGHFPDLTQILSEDPHARPPPSGYR